MAFFSMDKLLMFIVFLTPLSIPLKELIPNLDFDMHIPTEPLLFGILLIFIFKMAYERNFDRKVLVHPISIMIYLYLIWIFIASITSTMPIVSFKYLLSKLWFIAAFYFLASQLFKDRKKVYSFIWVYIIPMIIVIGYTLFRHSKFGLLDQEAANFVVYPFFNDHTSYGAMLALFFPIIIGLLVSKRYNPLTKVFIWVVFFIFLAAIVLSYTRATWISIAAGLGVFIVIILRIRFRYVFAGFIIIMVLFFSFRTSIMISLEQNRQESSTNFTEHIQSMSNVTSDASNMERLNRWNCALRMFEEKPVFGWGPGTYMFKYAPFQLSYEKTIISTNAGDMGNAHSEYLGPLAEAGILGMITFTLIVILSIYTALKVYRRLKDTELKILLLSVFIGMVTYYLHGFLNNFLDTDKASIPFWGFTALMLVMDIYYQKEQNTEEKVANKTLDQ